ncbi:MAG TPA: hypothetical protein VMS08_01255 [Candidatus Saccharimonadia bacterium]|nr:hypothetical protein [Candidatus Saccharimonadia bacterium]
MGFWKQPPVIKLYEALGALGDGRVEMHGDHAVIWSSMRKKHYEVSYDEASGAIMANDNGSYWQGYLGYPAIGYLLARGVVSYDSRLAEYFQGFDWKAIATKYKNNWGRVEQQVREKAVATFPEIDLSRLDANLAAMMQDLMALNLVTLGTKQLPPS